MLKSAVFFPWMGLGLPSKQGKPGPAAGALDRAESRALLIERCAAAVLCWQSVAGPAVGVSGAVCEGGNRSNVTNPRNAFILLHFEKQTVQGCKHFCGRGVSTSSAKSALFSS